MIFTTALISRHVGSAVAFIDDLTRFTDGVDYAEKQQPLHGTATEWLSSFHDFFFLSEKQQPIWAITATEWLSSLHEFIFSVREAWLG